jgi:predicted hotdog family 3-hydroxylacyl-ACP dehydratase
MKAALQGAVRRQLDFNEIARLVPFGRACLLIDRVLSWDDRTIVVERAVSGGDPTIAAHMPDGPAIMQGDLQIELVNQAVVLLLALRNGADTGAAPSPAAGGAGVLGRVKARFSRPVWVGEIVRATVTIESVLGTATAYEGLVTVDGEVAADISVVGTVASLEPPQRPPAGVPPRRALQGAMA